MAGVWESWSEGNETIDSCCIVTRNRNSKIQAYPDRIPLIVPPLHYSDWLNAHLSVHQLKELLIPLVEDNTSIHPVSKEVNAPPFNNQNCICVIPQMI